MPHAGTKKLPLPLRPLSRLGPGRPWGAIGHRLAASLLHGDSFYKDAAGFAFRIDPDDHFQRLMLMGWFDPMMEALFRPYVKPGGVIVDAGANVGYFTLRFARGVGPDGEVHSFECDPRLIGRLREHVERAGFSWVSVNEAAVHESSGEDLTFRLTDQVGWGSVEDDVWEASEVVRVPSMALDDYLAERGVDAERLSLVKIDVEGAERPALAGMAETLRRGAPAVLVEIVPWRLENQGRSVDELTDFMRSLGYEPWSPRRFERGEVELERGAEPALGEDVLFLKDVEAS